MQYFVHGVDGDAATEQLDLLAEAHWTYMDGYADSLVARGPTLSADGVHHTGSIHVLEAASLEDARRFAFEEPFWIAGVYASVTVAPFHNALDRDDVGQAIAAPRVDQFARTRGVAGAAICPRTAEVLRRLADSESLVFGGLLLSDNADLSVGLAAAFDADAERASTIAARIALPEPVTRDHDVPLATRGPQPGVILSPGDARRLAEEVRRHGWVA